MSICQSIADRRAWGCSWAGILCKLHPIRWGSSNDWLQLNVIQIPTTIKQGHLTKTCCSNIPSWPRRRTSLTQTPFLRFQLLHSSNHALSSEGETGYIYSDDLWSWRESPDSLSPLFQDSFSPSLSPRSSALKIWQIEQRCSVGLQTEANTQTANEDRLTRNHAASGGEGIVFTWLLFPEKGQE